MLFNKTIWLALCGLFFFSANAFAQNDYDDQETRELEAYLKSQKQKQMLTEPGNRDGWVQDNREVLYETEFAGKVYASKSDNIKYDSTLVSNWKLHQYIEKTVGKINDALANTVDLIKSPYSTSNRTQEYELNTIAINKTIKTINDLNKEVDTFYQAACVQRPMKIKVDAVKMLDSYHRLLGLKVELEQLLEN